MLAGMSVVQHGLGPVAPSHEVIGPASSTLGAIRMKMRKGCTNAETECIPPALDPDESEIAQMFTGTRFGDQYEYSDASGSRTDSEELLGVLMFDASSHCSIPALVVGETRRSGQPPHIRLVAKGAPLGIMEGEVVGRPACCNSHCSCFDHTMFDHVTAMLRSQSRLLAGASYASSYSMQAAAYERPDCFEIENLLPIDGPRRLLQLERWGVVPFLRLRPAATDDEVEQCALAFFDAIKRRSFSTHRVEQKRAPGVAIDAEDLDTLRDFGAGLASEASRSSVHLVSTFTEAEPVSPRLTPTLTERDSWAWQVSLAHASRAMGIQTLIDLAAIILLYCTTESCSPDPVGRPGTLGHGDEESDMNITFGPCKTACEYPKQHVMRCIAAAMRTYGSEIGPRKHSSDEIPPLVIDPPTAALEDEDDLFRAFNSPAELVASQGANGPIPGFQFVRLARTSLGAEVCRGDRFVTEDHTVAPCHVSHIDMDAYRIAGKVSQECMRAMDSVYAAIPLGSESRDHPVEFLVDPRVDPPLEIDPRTYTDEEGHILEEQRSLGALIDGDFPLGHVARALADSCRDSQSPCTEWSGGVLIMTLRVREDDLQNASLGTCVFARGMFEGAVTEVPPCDVLWLYRRRDVLTFVRTVNPTSLHSHWMYAALNYGNQPAPADPVSHLMAKPFGYSTKNPPLKRARLSLGLMSHSKASHIRLLQSPSAGNQSAVAPLATRSTESKETARNYRKLAQYAQKL